MRVAGLGRLAPHSTDADRRLNLYLRLLCHFQRVVDLDAQVPHGAFQFVQLHDPQILGPSIDQRALVRRIVSVRQFRTRLSRDRSLEPSQQRFARTVE
jgi:hypothetical protein